MHGLKNALEDSVPLLRIAAETNPGERGKGPIHEIEPETFDTVVKANFSIERPLELREKLALGIQLALTEPYGPIRFGIPPRTSSKGKLSNQPFPSATNALDTRTMTYITRPQQSSGTRRDPLYTREAVSDDHATGVKCCNACRNP